MEQISAASSYLSVLYSTESRQCFDSQFFLALGEAEENSRHGIVHRRLVQQLFGQRSLATRRRADEQIESWKETVQGAAQIYKTRLPAGDLLDGVLCFKLVKNFGELCSFGLQGLFFSH